jgi:hypothetical protein
MKSALVTIFLLLTCTAHAQQPWPAKPMRIIVSTGPGLATDIVARTIAGGQMLARPMAPQEIAEELRAERARWAKIADDIGLKPQ